MEHEKAQTIYRAMEAGLEEIASNEPLILNCLAKSIGFVRGKLKELLSHSVENPPADEGEEILYFRKMLPPFYASLIYYIGYYNLEKGSELIPGHKLNAYLAEEERYISRFFQQNHFLYEYYRLGSTELDTFYFTSAASGNALLLPEFPFLDCPGGTQLFSRFIAYEKLKDLIREKTESARYASFAGDGKAENEARLSWTGDSINLVELAYGLYLTGQIGHGNVSLNRIVRCLEANFQVELVHVSRRFTEISRRKRLSYTRFIDKMRDAIHQRVEEDAKKCGNNGLR